MRVSHNNGVIRTGTKLSYSIFVQDMQKSTANTSQVYCAQPTKLYMRVLYILADKISVHFGSIAFRLKGAFAMLVFQHGGHIDS